MSPSYLSTGLRFLKRELGVPGMDGPEGLIHDSQLGRLLQTQIFADAGAKEEVVVVKVEENFSHFTPSTQSVNRKARRHERATLPLGCSFARPLLTMVASDLIGPLERMMIW